MLKQAGVCREVEFGGGGVRTEALGDPGVRTAKARPLGHALPVPLSVEGGGIVRSLPESEAGPRGSPCGKALFSEKEKRGRLGENKDKRKQGKGVG